MRGFIVIAAALVLGATMARAQVRWTGSGWVGDPMNLQVLPPDISRRDLVELMKSYTTALDVSCGHCHVGPGDDLAMYDFASDETPAKQIARKMLTMMSEINGALAAVGEPPASGAPKVTCYTCHRGATKPLTSPPARGGGPVRWLFPSHAPGSYPRRSAPISS